MRLSRRCSIGRTSLNSQPGGDLVTRAASGRINFGEDLMRLRCHTHSPSVQTCNCSMMLTQLGVGLSYGGSRATVATSSAGPKAPTAGSTPAFLITIGPNATSLSSGRNFTGNGLLSAVLRSPRCTTRPALLCLGRMKRWRIGNGRHL